MIRGRSLLFFKVKIQGTWEIVSAQNKLKSTNKARIIKLDTHVIHIHQIAT